MPISVPIYQVILVVVMFGANDATAPGHPLHVSVDDFRENMQG